MIVRVLGKAGARVLDRVADGVFDNPIDAARAAEFLSDPRHHLAVAIEDEQVVGMASAVHYVHPDKAPELWINEVGVAPAVQRRGIGKQLMRALFEHGRTLGCREAWLGTEAENEAARALYAAVGGAEEPMIYVTFDLGSESARKER